MDGSQQQESSIKSGARLHDGPGLLQLIENPDFRLHFEKEARPAAPKPHSGVQTLVADELMSNAETTPERRENPASSLFLIHRSSESSETET